MNETANSTVQAVSVEEVLSGSAKMPFTNPNAWKSAQHEDPLLRRLYAHLTTGTRPSRKSKHMKDLRKLLSLGSVDNNGLLVVKKLDPYINVKSLIIVPTLLLPGIVTALHLKFGHPTKSQLSRIFNRYFFGLKSTEVINDIIDQCSQCNSMKYIAPELLSQSTSSMPDGPGDLMAADIMKRNKQNILVVRDYHSSFTSTAILPNEQAESLRTGILTTTCLLRRGIIPV